MNRTHRIAQLILAELTEEMQHMLAERYQVPPRVAATVVRDVRNTSYSIREDLNRYNDLIVEFILKGINDRTIRYPEDAYKIYAIHNYLAFMKDHPQFRILVKRIFPDKNPKNLLAFTMQDVEEANDAFSNPKYDENVNKVQAKLPEGAELYYTDKTWQIVRVSGADAACTLARGTKWCTGSRDYLDRPGTAMGYLRSGPLYIFYKSGKKFGQLHIDRNTGDFQFMDLRDRTIVITPELEEVFVKAGLAREIEAGREAEQEERNRLFRVLHNQMNQVDR